MILKVFCLRAVIPGIFGGSGRQRFSAVRRH